jgi:hypothetical protein
MAIISKAATALRQPDTWIYILFVAVMVGLSTGVFAQGDNVKATVARRPSPRFTGRWDCRRGTSVWARKWFPVFGHRCGRRP